MTSRRRTKANKPPVDRDMSFTERKDGPRPDDIGRVGRRRTKHTSPRARSEYDLAAFLFTCRFLHDRTDEFELCHRVGRPLEITPIVAVVIEFLTGKFGSQREVVLNHTTRWVWDYYCAAVRAVFPTEPHMWLPDKPPTRTQIRNWLDTRLNDDDTLAAFHQLLEDLAVLASSPLGIGIPQRDSVTHPGAAVCLSGDGTYLRGMYNTSYDEAIDKESGELRTLRTDPDALKVQQDRGYPGYRMTHVAAYNGHEREQLVYALDITPGQQGSEATTYLDMALPLLARLPGMRAIVYDGAMYPVHIDRALSSGLIVINRPQLTSKGEIPRFNIGEHEFTTSNGASHHAVITFIDGPPCVTVATAEGHHEIPLVRRRNKRRKNADGSFTMYGIWAYPDEAIVPPHLRGATTFIRFNSTEEELAAGLRRSRAGRMIPPCDSDFDPTYGIRNTTENRHHQLKVSLPNKRLNAVGINRVRRRLIAHFIVANIEATLAWHERTGGDIAFLTGPPPPLADAA